MIESAKKFIQNAAAAASLLSLSSCCMTKHQKTDLPKSRDEILEMHRKNFVDNGVIKVFDGPNIYKPENKDKKK